MMHKALHPRDNVDRLYIKIKCRQVNNEDCFVYTIKELKTDEGKTTHIRLALNYNEQIDEPKPGKQKLNSGNINNYMNTPVDNKSSGK